MKMIFVHKRKGKSIRNKINTKKRQHYFIFGLAALFYVPVTISLSVELEDSPHVVGIQKKLQQSSTGKSKRYASSRTQFDDKIESKNRSIKLQLPLSGKRNNDSNSFAFGDTIDNDDDDFTLLSFKIQDAIDLLQANGFEIAQNCEYATSYIQNAAQDYDPMICQVLDETVGSTYRKEKDIETISETKTLLTQSRRILSHDITIVRHHHRCKKLPVAVQNLQNITDTSTTDFQDSNINPSTRNNDNITNIDEQGNKTYSDDDNYDDEIIEEENPWLLTINLLGALACVTVAAVAAGLTLGLLGLDPLMLLIKERAAVDLNERKMASALLPVIKKHHLLLVSLLLMNSIANEALPIFLEKLVPPMIAVLLSVTLVLFFGEIIPSAIFTGPNQLKIAYNLVPLVKFVMTVLYPIAGPIAKLLDCLLGGGTDNNNEHSTTTGTRIRQQQHFTTSTRTLGSSGGSDDYDDTVDDTNHHHDHEMISTYDRGELAALIRIQYERFSNKNKKRKERKNIVKPYSSGQSNKFGDYTATIHQTKRLFERGVSLNSDELKKVMNSSDSSPKNTNNSNNTDQQHQHHHRAISDLNDPTDTKKLSNDVELARDHNRTSSIVLDEVMMVEGALQMKTKVAFDVFTALKNVYAIPNTMILDEQNMVAIYASGYTRIPVYDDDIGKTRKNPKSAIIGILVTKLLIVVNPKDKRTVGSLPLRLPQCVSPGTPLVDLINMFQTGGSRGGHQALVCTLPSVGNRALQYEGKCLPEKAGLIGIITMEDALEILLQEQIYDEMDKEHRAGHRLAEMILRRWRIYVKKRDHEREVERWRKQRLEEKKKEKVLDDFSEPKKRFSFFSKQNSTSTSSQINADTPLSPSERTSLLKRTFALERKIPK